MKFKIKTFLSLTIIAALIVLSVPFEVKAEETEYKLNHSKIYLEPGDVSELTVIGYDDDIKWTSSDKNIVTVKNGIITAVSEGSAKITAKSAAFKLKCKVYVKAETSIKIIAVGDNLYHDKIIRCGLQNDGTYNYDYIYSHIKDYIADADVKIINQETVFVDDPEDYSGYPSFGTPYAVGDAVRNAGFNVITQATNHSYDKGKKALLGTINYWNQYKDEVLMTGIYNSKDSYNTISVREYNGIKVAFLNYTYGINGSRSKMEKSYYIKFIDKKLIKSEIEKARKLADFVIVLPHWGEEYTHKENSTQQELATLMAEAGADCIIGCHPHVVQPLKIIETSDGREVPCFYSLGNFVANMSQRARQLEAMAEIEISLRYGKITIESCQMTPLVNHMNKMDEGHTVYLLSEYTQKLADKHFIDKNEKASDFTVKNLQKLFDSIK